ncbi:hypothetical protein FB451DRAFT_108934 [Mycena latifolia]|nr:hypothetical protein FB451DRAFT_108934 [Mycena latifolia]
MFHHSSQNPVGGLQRVDPPKRTRVPLACVRCRKRKVKCSINEENLSKPYTQCARGGVVCEYMSVDEERAQSASVHAGEMPSPNAISPSTSGPSEQTVHPPSDKSRPNMPVRQRSQPSSPFIPAKRTRHIDMEPCCISHPAYPYSIRRLDCLRRNSLL